MITREESQGQDETGIIREKNVETRDSVNYNHISESGNIWNLRLLEYGSAVAAPLSCSVAQSIALVTNLRSR